MEPDGGKVIMGYELEWFWPVEIDMQSCVISELVKIWDFK
jgi:hypothetical protein